jgi:hypothetical protein
MFSKSVGIYLKYHFLNNLENQNNFSMILNMSEELNTKTLGDELWQAPANSEITKAEFEEKSQQLIAEAISIMDEKYGPEGKEPKLYHNPLHIDSVWLKAKEIARKSVLSAEDTLLLKIAAHWHDVDSNQETGVDEIKSSNTIMKKMIEMGFKPIHIRKVVEAILATQWYNDDNGAIAQKVNSILGQKVPTPSAFGFPEGATTLKSNLKPKEMQEVLQLKKIMADADLYGMGSEWDTYFPESILICRELGILPEHAEPYSEEEWIKFYDVQINLLEGFTQRSSARTKDEGNPTHFGYYTAEAQSLLPHTQSNLEKLRELRAEFDN